MSNILFSASRIFGFARRFTKIHELEFLTVYLNRMQEVRGHLKEQAYSLNTARLCRASAFSLEKPHSADL